MIEADFAVSVLDGGSGASSTEIPVQGGAFG